MGVQHLGMGERFPTGVAGELPLVQVCPGVVLQVRGLAEAFPTHVA